MIITVGSLECENNFWHTSSPTAQPDELVDFALAYFTRLKAKRNAIAAENNNLSDESMLSEDEEFGECSTPNI